MKQINKLFINETLLAKVTLLGELKQDKSITKAVFDKQVQIAIDEAKTAHNQLNQPTKEK